MKLFCRSCLSMLVLVGTLASVARSEEAVPSAAAAPENATAPVAEAAPAEAAAPTVVIADMQVATGIEDRMPIGAGETFPAGTEKLYCFIKTTGAQAGDEIVHRWKKGEEVMGEVTLKLGGSPWRTWSSKVLMPDWTGAWTVEVLQGGKVLKTAAFTIQ